MGNHAVSEQGSVPPPGHPEGRRWSQLPSWLLGQQCCPFRERESVSLVVNSGHLRADLFSTLGGHKVIRQLWNLQPMARAARDGTGPTSFLVRHYPYGTFTSGHNKGQDLVATSTVTWGKGEQRGGAVPLTPYRPSSSSRSICQPCL